MVPPFYPGRVNMTLCEKKRPSNGPGVASMPFLSVSSLQKDSLQGPQERDRR